MSKVIHLDANSFDKAISQGTVLVDFWAEWCGPCKSLGPILDDLSNEVGEGILISKVDIDNAQEIAAKFKVRSIPAIFIFKDGELVNQFIGLQDKTTLKNALESA